MKIEISLKEFKRLIKDAGYTHKTYISGYYNKYRFLEILDKDKNFICGAGANVYKKEFINKHKKAFDLINNYIVYDEEGDKVLF
jgi:hypothetical protein